MTLRNLKPLPAPNVPEFDGPVQTPTWRQFWLTLMGWFEDVISTLGSLQTQITANGTSIGALNTQMSTANSNISTLQTYASNHPYAFASLPAPGTIGRLAYLTDGAAALAWGANAAGGGTAKYLLWDNGTNWTVVGK